MKACRLASPSLSDLELRASDLEFRASDLELRASDLELRASDLEFRYLECLEVKIEGLGSSQRTPRPLH